jgi:DNA-binding NtrC family response regulator
MQDQDTQPKISQKTGDPPVRVLLVGARDLEEYLADLDVIGINEKLIAGLFSPRRGRDARVIVVSRKALEGFDLADTIARIRTAWPLVDVIIWAPQAESGFVRDALKAGVKDVLLTESPEICSRAIANIIAGQQLMPKAARLGFEQNRAAVFEGMLARSPAMWDVFDAATRIAPTDAAVLLLGETGTGKELLARAVHRRSGRDGRFVAINCAAIAENLIDSELFGHVKGSFTGATHEKAGLFRHADGGTLMLDEVGAMPPAAQHHLLRALQEESVRPVGGHREIPVDVRIIAATSTTLEADIAAGRFREDLYYRLDVIRLEMPPLRERLEDIIFLFGHFVRDFAKQYDVPRPEFTEAFLDGLIRYEWPGNVRQLENFTERLVLTHGGGKVTAEHLRQLLPFMAPGKPHMQESSGTGSGIGSDTTSPTRLSLNDVSDTSEIAQATSDPDPVTAPTMDTSRTLEETLAPHLAEVEAGYLRECLRRTRGRISKSADIAGINRRTLLRKLKQYGIDKADYRGSRQQNGGTDT